MLCLIVTCCFKFKPSSRGDSTYTLKPLCIGIVAIIKMKYFIMEYTNTSLLSMDSTKCTVDQLYNEVLSLYNCLEPTVLYTMTRELLTLKDTVYNTITELELINILRFNCKFKAAIT
jgi:hypothetical protein